MLRVAGLHPCDGSSVEFDPWVPLDVSWHVDCDEQPIYLMVTGTPSGYVEIKVHPSSGALIGLTVIELPVDAKHAAPEVRELVGSLVPTLDITAWGDAAKATAPEKRVVSTRTDMSHSTSPERFVLTLSDNRPQSRVRCGQLAVDISDGGELVRLIATQKWAEPA